MSEKIEFNQRIEIRKVAAGMRAASHEPVALMFIDGIMDWTWDTPDILGIPVFHSEWIRTPNDDRGDPCPWMMLFANDSESFNSHKNYRFFTGYDEYNDEEASHD